MTTLAAALAALGLLAAAWLVHTRVRGFLPDDPPGPGRKAHGRPIAMAGFVPGAVSAVVLLRADRPWLAAAVAAAVLVGTADDVLKYRGRDGLGVRWKLLGLLGSSAAIAWATDLPLGAALLAFAFAFVVTNACNFLDNQNGVAATLGGLGLLIVGRGDLDHPATALGATWLAFLPFNWPTARMFLGDSGALGLGAGLAGLALSAARTGTGIDWCAAILPASILLLDFVQVVSARVLLGYAPWKGDRRHLTHVLLNHGVPAWALAPGLGLLALLLGVGGLAALSG